MASRGATADVRPPRQAFVWKGVTALSVAAMVALVAGVFALQAVEQAIVTDARFVLPAPALFTDAPPNLRIEGVAYGPRERVARVFQRDFGRSLYLLPLAERRRNLLAIDWVKDATVSRQWPDRVVVRVTEREPVAFAAVDGEGGVKRMLLIDEDGVLLDPPPKTRFRLPVVTGIRRGQSAAARRDAARRVIHLVKELGPLMAKVSEADVSEPENLKVTLPSGDRALVLMLGNRRLRARLESFLDHEQEVRRRLPSATTIDLRVDERFFAADGGAGVR